MQARFDSWLAQKTQNGATFTPDQLAWLELMRDHIATSQSLESGDFDYSAFAQQRGLGKAHQFFGDGLNRILDELNVALVV